MEIEFFARAVLLAGLATVGVQQVLRLKIVPVGFANRYPVLTNIILSIGASVLTVWQDNKIQPVVWTDWALLISMVAVTAAIVYNMVFRNWRELQAIQGEK